MATLQNIGQGGLVGTAPTPVLARAINKYLVNDEFMNIMRFVNEGQGNNLGNFQTSFVYYNGTSEATFRALGVNYTPDNEQPLTDTVMLKMLGGAFESDMEIARAFGSNPSGVANWTEQQIAQKLNAIKNGFAKYFIQGNATSVATQFDGLNAKISAGQVVTNAINVSALTADKALQIEVAINKVIAKVKPARPNVLLTTAEGKAILSSLNAFRNRGVEAVEVNGKKYDQYMGIPMVALEGTCFPKADTDIGIPVVFILLDEFEGVRTTIPMDGEVVKILPPKFDNGKVVEQGACEMMCAPMFANPFAVAKCYIDELGEQ